MRKCSYFLRKYRKFEGVKTQRMMNPDFTVRSSSRVYIASAMELLPHLVAERRVVVITDATIDRLYGELLAPYEKILIGRGETIKTLQTVEQIIRQLVALGADRKTLLLAVGGGIISDITGFVASIYMRGIRFGFVSTTLLGQVDASVGGKNGVNLDGYKNMVGCFTQPEFVICDPAMLTTLPEREFRAGLAEIVKATIIGDAAMFERLEHATLEELRQDHALLAEAVRNARKVADVLAEAADMEIVVPLIIEMPAARVSYGVLRTMNFKSASADVAVEESLSELNLEVRDIKLSATVNITYSMNTCA